jgi:hypothetical protein
MILVAQLLINIAALFLGFKLGDAWAVYCLSLPSKVGIPLIIGTSILLVWALIKLSNG